MGKRNEQFEYRINTLIEFVNDESLRLLILHSTDFDKFKTKCDYALAYLDGTKDAVINFCLCSKKQVEIVVTAEKTIKEIYFKTKMAVEDPDYHYPI